LPCKKYKEYAIDLLTTTFCHINPNADLKLCNATWYFGSVACLLIDQIIVGSYHRRLSVYQPKFDINGGFKAEDIIFEIQFSDPILQIETGRFVS
jgi:PTHB1 N-terminus